MAPKKSRSQGSRRMVGWRLARMRRLTTSARWARRSALSAKYWKRLPLLTPASRAMTLRLPRKKPLAPNSASAAARTASRRAAGSRSHVLVGTHAPPGRINPCIALEDSLFYDHWSYDHRSYEDA